MNEREPEIEPADDLVVPAWFDASVGICCRLGGIQLRGPCVLAQVLALIGRITLLRFTHPLRRRSSVCWSASVVP